MFRRHQEGPPPGWGTTRLGDTNGACRGTDHRSPVAHHQKLGLFGLPGDQSGQALHIDPIEEAVDLIKGIKGRGTEALQGKQKAERRQ